MKKKTPFKKKRKRGCVKTQMEFDDQFDLEDLDDGEGFERAEEFNNTRKRDFSSIMLEDDDHDNYYAEDIMASSKTNSKKKSKTNSNTLGVDMTTKSDEITPFLENRPQYDLTDNTAYYNLVSMIVLLFGKSTQGTSVKSIFASQGLFIEDAEFDF